MHRSERHRDGRQSATGTLLACAEADGVLLTGSLSAAEVATEVASIHTLVARSSRLDRRFDVVLWIRATSTTGRRTRASGAG